MDALGGMPGRRAGWKSCRSESQSVERTSLVPAEFAGSGKGLDIRSSAKLSFSSFIVSGSRRSLTVAAVRSVGAPWPDQASGDWPRRGANAKVEAGKYKGRQPALTAPWEDSFAGWRSVHGHKAGTRLLGCPEKFDPPWMFTGIIGHFGPGRRRERHAGPGFS